MWITRGEYFFTNNFHVSTIHHVLYTIIYNADQCTIIYQTVCTTMVKIAERNNNISYRTTNITFTEMDALTLRFLLRNDFTARLTDLSTIPTRLIDFLLKTIYWKKHREILGKMSSLTYWCNILFQPRPSSKSECILYIFTRRNIIVAYHLFL